MTECPICRRQSDEGQHGRCVETLVMVFREQVMRLQAEIERLRSELQDAGITRKDRP